MFFDGTFLVGIFEQTENGKLSVCKVTFGIEPKENEIQESILKEYNSMKLSPAVENEVITKGKINPKRI